MDKTTRRTTKWPWRLPARASGWPGDVPRLPPPKRPHAGADPCATTSYGCVAVLLVAAIAGCVVAIMGRASARAHETAVRASCQNNLKQLGLVLQAYASAHGGLWPDLRPSTGILQPDWAVLQGLNPLNHALTCPAERNHATNTSYYYLGYELTSDDDAEAFAAAVSVRLMKGNAFDSDLPRPDVEPGASIARLRDHDGAAHAPRAGQVPVMLEKATNHYSAGMHVLYQDGHVEYIKIGEKFPATRRTLTALAALEPGLYPAAPLAPPHMHSWEPENCGHTARAFVLLGPKN